MRLTVFTPTYNRKDLLARAYESLCRQTVKDFEWLIVDDGSTDNTDDIVKGWIDEGRIRIRYRYRENGGKMRAHNMGVELCETALFMCLDSDDYLIDTAVEEMLAAYDEAVAANDGSEKIGGVVAHKGCTSKKLLGKDDFPPVKTSTLYGLYLKGFSGETTLMYETDILRAYPFPETEGEKYVPEDYIYDKIDSVCVLAVLPRIITVCELVESGYTDSVKRLKRENVNAFYLYYEQRAFITPRSIRKLKYLGRYVIYAKRSGRSVFAGSRLKFTDILLGCIYAGCLLLTHKE